MQASLMNFGHNTRVVNDVNNSPISIGIGELKECNIHDVHFHMIRRAVATETLMVVPNDVKRSPRLVAIMDLLSKINTEPMNELTQMFNEIIPPDAGDHVILRPTRDAMRLGLRDAARMEVAMALKLQSKVFIREEKTPHTPPQPKTDDRKDGILDMVVEPLPKGESARKELTEQAQAHDMGYGDTKRPTKKKAAEAAPPKKSAKKSKKSAKKSKKPVKSKVKRERL